MQPIFIVYSQCDSKYYLSNLFTRKYRFRIAQKCDIYIDLREWLSIYLTNAVGTTVCIVQYSPWSTLLLIPWNTLLLIYTPGDRVVLVIGDQQSPNCSESIKEESVPVKKGICTCTKYEYDLLPIEMESFKRVFPKYLDMLDCTTTNNVS